jgi:hypothetical protein
VLGWPDCTVEGPSRHEVIRRARQILTDLLAEAELIQIEIEPPRARSALLQFAGMWAEDDTFDEFVAAMGAYRRDVDTEQEANAMMMNTVSAIYEDGVFRPLAQPPELAEHQQVQLYFVVTDQAWPLAPMSLEENLRFVRETMGLWRVADPEFRRWLAEEASLFDEDERL